MKKILEFFKWSKRDENGVLKPWWRIEGMGVPKRRWQGDIRKMPMKRIIYNIFIGGILFAGLMYGFSFMNLDTYQYDTIPFAILSGVIFLKECYDYYFGEIQPNKRGDLQHHMDFHLRDMVLKMLVSFIWVLYHFMF